MRDHSTNKRNDTIIKFSPRYTKAERDLFTTVDNEDFADDDIKSQHFSKYLVDHG